MVRLLKYPPNYPVALRALNTLTVGKEDEFVASLFDLIVAKPFSAPLRSGRLKQVADLDDLQTLTNEVRSSSLPVPPSHAEWVQKFLNEKIVCLSNASINSSNISMYRAKG